MEKVKIKMARDSGKQWNGKPIFEVLLEDGRIGSSYDEKIVPLSGKEAELEIKEGKEYKGVMQYYFNLPKAAGAGGKFPAKDWSYEKRKSSLECSVNCVAHTGKTVTTENVLALAEKFYEYLNKK